MSKKWIIFLLFLVSLLVRIRFMDNGLFHHDSVHLATLVENYVQTGELGSMVEGRQLLILIFSLFYYLPYHVFSVSAETTVTLVSIIFGSLSVIVFFLLAEELFQDKKLAWISALVFSFNPIFFSISTHARSYSLAMLFILSSLYLLVRGIRKNSFKLQMISTSLLGLGLFIRYSSILILIPHFLLFYTSGKRKWSIYLPLLGCFILAQGMLNLQSYSTIPLIGLFNYSYSTGYFSLLKSVFQTLSLPGLALVIAGIILMWLQNKKKLLFILLAWILVYVIFYSNSILNNISYPSPRYFMEILFPLAILAAVPLIELKKISWGKIPAYLILIIILLLSFSQVYPHVEFRHTHSSGKELVNNFDKFTGNNSVLVAPPGYHLFFEYYDNRTIIACPERVNVASLDKLNRSIEKEQREIYFFSDCLKIPPIKERQMLADFLTDTYEIEAIGEDFVWESYNHAENFLYLRHVTFLHLQKR